MQRHRFLKVSFIQVESVRFWKYHKHISRSLWNLCIAIRLFQWNISGVCQGLIQMRPITYTLFSTQYISSVTTGWNDVPYILGDIKHWFSQLIFQRESRLYQMVYRIRWYWQTSKRANLAIFLNTVSILADDIYYKCIGGRVSVYLIRLFFLSSLL